MFAFGRFVLTVDLCYLELPYSLNQSSLVLLDLQILPILLTPIHKLYPSIQTVPVFLIIPRVFVWID